MKNKIGKIILELDEYLKDKDYNEGVYLELLKNKYILGYLERIFKDIDVISRNQLNLLTNKYRVQKLFNIYLYIAGIEVVEVSDLDLKEDLYSEVGYKNYSLELANLKILTREQELEYFAKMNNGDMIAKEELIKSQLKWVKLLAKEYMNKGLEYDDLIQIGNMAVITAVDNFKPENETRLITYSTIWIRSMIKRAISKNKRECHNSLYFENSEETIDNDKTILNYIQDSNSLTEYDDILTENYLEQLFLTIWPRQHAKFKDIFTKSCLENMSYVDIAKIYGVSRQRIEQIVKDTKMSVKEYIKKKDW